MSAGCGSSSEGRGSDRFVPAQRWRAGRQRDATTESRAGTGTANGGTALHGRISSAGDSGGQSYDARSAGASGRLDDRSSPAIDLSFDRPHNTIPPLYPASTAAASPRLSDFFATPRTTPFAGRGRPAKRARLKASGQSVPIPPGAMLPPRPAQGASSFSRETAPHGAWSGNSPPPISASTFTTSSAVPPSHTGWHPSCPTATAAEWRSKASDDEQLLSERPVSPPASTAQQPTSSILALTLPSLSPPGDTAAAASTLSSMPRGSGTSRSSFCLQSTASSPADFHDTSITDSPSSRRSSYDPRASSNESSATDDGARALIGLAELARRPSPFLHTPVSTAALTSAQAWDVDKGVDETEKTSKCDVGDQRRNEQAKKAEGEEDFGEQAALEGADRLRKRLLDIA